MEPTTQLQRTADLAKRLVQGVGDDQLDQPTPCEDWDVRALVGHMLGGSVMFSRAAVHGAVPKETLAEITAPGYVGDDFREQFSAATDEAVRAFSDPAAMSTSIELPFGTMPAPAVRSMLIFDLVVHAADLAQATGQAFDDAELAEVSLALGRQTEAALGESFRGPRVFGPEQESPVDADPAARLLSFAGRQVT